MDPLMLPRSLFQAFGRNFLGNSPFWYKSCLLLFLVANPILFTLYGSFITGWILVGEFIFTLAMALKCHPLPAGGLLAIESVVIGMTEPNTVFKETLANFEVILLLIFVVAGIYFMKDFLRFAFTPVIRLSYGRMVYLALPYTITMSLTGLAATYLFL